MNYEWTEYEPEGGDYIPVERWGRDHWSTFAYLETCAVDRGGIIHNARMRCNSRLHRHFLYTHVFDPVDGKGYPTRLKDGDIDNHDDWSCLEDMVAAGLIRSWYRQVNSKTFGNSEGKVQLTALGSQVAGQLRAHKAAGGMFANFDLARDKAKCTELTPASPHPLTRPP